MATSFYRLCQQFQAGELSDDLFYRALQGRYENALTGYLGARGIFDPETRESLVAKVLQSFFFRVRSGKFEIRGDAEITSYLYMRTHGAAKSHFRTIKRRQETSFPADFEVADWRREVAAQELAEILDILSEQERGYICDRYLNGLRYRELAELQDCAISTVAGRIERAMAKLRLAAQE